MNNINVNFKLITLLWVPNDIKFDAASYVYHLASGKI